MMFSKACEYGIKSMIYIAQKTSDGSKVSIDEIAKGIDSPRPFTAAVLQDLSRQKLVSSSKGPHGGFFLESKAKKVPLSEIVKAIDGEAIFTSCGLGIKTCSEDKPCPLHHQFKAIRTNIVKMLKTNTIQDLAKEVQSGDFFLMKK